MSNIDANPAPIESLCDLNASAAATKRVENNVPFVGADFKDAFQERFGLLRWISSRRTTMLRLATLSLVVRKDRGRV
jgi:hypothetical protein